MQQGSEEEAGPQAELVVTKPRWAAGLCCWVRKQSVKKRIFSNASLWRNYDPTMSSEQYNQDGDETL